MLVQITPEYPPKIGGVGSYAANITQSFQYRGELLHTIVTNNHHDVEPSNKVYKLISSTGQELQRSLEDLGSTSVLLHFSGYGYARWGLCYWLVKGLREWKKDRKDRRIVTIFHEVYATGLIWRASFWTSPPQQQIARDLAKLSDMAFVTSQGGYEMLKPLYPELSLEILPVFSNIGEPDEVIPLNHREGIAVVFGGTGQRDQTYRVLKHHTDALMSGFEKLAITEIIDIGPGHCAPKQLAGFPVRTLGILSAETVSNWLKCVRIAILNYPLSMITKSTIFAAYLAHGVLTVNTSCVGHIPKDLVEGREFVNLYHFSKGAFDAQTIASNGFVWYQLHNLSKITDQLRDSLVKHF